MRAYEAVLVLAPTLDEEAVGAFLVRVREAIEHRHGNITAVERWGKRRLAYDIRDCKEAHYILFRFQAEPVGGTDELQHVCRISEDVLRHLIVLELESTSSPMRADAKSDGDEPVAANTAAGPAAAKPATLPLPLEADVAPAMGTPAGQEA